MLTTLPLLAALSLAAGQGADLELNNARATYGYWGPTRPDDKVLPGDVYLLTFDIDNLKVDAAGKVRYSIGMEVRDSKNKVHYKRDPRELEAVNSLGGGHLVAFPTVDIPVDHPPGRYTVKITVTDVAAKRTKSFEKKFDVVEPTFGIVRFNLTSDPYAQVLAPPAGFPGQTLWIHTALAGFVLGPRKEPDLTLEMSVFDENDKATLAKPFVYNTTKWVQEVNLAPMPIALPLNRAGKFTVKLKATDNIGKKTAEHSFSLTVLEAK